MNVSETAFCIIVLLLVCTEAEITSRKQTPFGGLLHRHSIASAAKRPRSIAILNDQEIELPTLLQVWTVHPLNMWALLASGTHFLYIECLQKPSSFFDDDFVECDNDAAEPLSWSFAIGGSIYSIDEADRGSLINNALQYASHVFTGSEPDKQKKLKSTFSDFHVTGGRIMSLRALSPSSGSFVIRLDVKNGESPLSTIMLEGSFVTETLSEKAGHTMTAGWVDQKGDPLPLQCFFFRLYTENPTQIELTTFWKSTANDETKQISFFFIQQMLSKEASSPKDFGYTIVRTSNSTSLPPILNETTNASLKYKVDIISDWIGAFWSIATIGCFALIRFGPRCWINWKTRGKKVVPVE